MSLKNLSVVNKIPKKLKTKLLNKRILKLYKDFEKSFNIKDSFIVAISGGPDSLALAAMCKALESNNRKFKFNYIHINHGIRKNSSKESEQVKKLLKKQNISLKVINNKKKIVKNIQHNERKIRYMFFRKECKKNKIRPHD